VIGIVHRVHEWFVKQLNGSRDAGRNCTMAAGCSLLYRHTHGRTRMHPQTLRNLTYDHVGGNTLDQLKQALARAGHYGFDGPYRGMGMATFYRKLKRGQGAVVQGSSAATAGTRWKASLFFRGNHAWYVSRGKDWRLVSGVLKPAYLRIFDPLADGRASGIATSPFWLPRAYFERFCALLSFGSYRLGYGRVYALFSKDTDPHVHRTRTGIEYKRRQVKLKAGHTIRRSPGGEIIRRTKSTDVFDMWGKIENGPLAFGSRIWVCDHSGTRWVHVSAFA
jgi:hypothetical protein